MYSRHSKETYLIMHYSSSVVMWCVLRCLSVLEMNELNRTACNNITTFHRKVVWLDLQVFWLKVQLYHCIYFGLGDVLISEQGLDIISSPGNSYVIMCCGWQNVPIHQYNTESNATPVWLFESKFTEICSYLLIKNLDGGCIMSTKIALTKFGQTTSNFSFKMMIFKAQYEYFSWLR